MHPAVSCWLVTAAVSGDGAAVWSGRPRTRTGTDTFPRGSSAGPSYPNSCRSQLALSRSSRSRTRCHTVRRAPVLQLYRRWDPDNRRRGARPDLEDGLSAPGPPARRTHRPLSPAALGARVGPHICGSPPSWIIDGEREERRRRNRRKETFKTG